MKEIPSIRDGVIIKGVSIVSLQCLTRKREESTTERQWHNKSRFSRAKKTRVRIWCVTSRSNDWHCLCFSVVLLLRYSMHCLTGSSTNICIIYFLHWTQCVIVWCQFLNNFYTVPNSKGIWGGPWKIKPKSVDLTWNDPEVELKNGHKIVLMLHLN